MVAPELKFPWKRMGKLVFAGLLVAVAAALSALVADEMRSSRRQAKAVNAISRDATFQVEHGPSAAIRFPGAGPYDERLGYHGLPEFIERLKSQGYEVTDQARMSPGMMNLTSYGLFPPYREKAQAGLELLDCRGDTLFSARYPERVYDGFESVPPLLVNALLFIENRELLDPENASRNPAVEWDRFAKAAFDRLRRFGDDARSPGGSTLATQIEKYRHSPEGRTESIKEKLRQMASASLRAYQDGENTMPRRRQIVVDYLNTVPLSAKAGFGEVNGLGDGLWVWYGRDFNEVNRLLAPGNGDGGAPPAELLPRQALAYKQALSLMIAQRRPSYYLAAGEAALNELTNSYLRIMADGGIIAPALRDAALPLSLKLQPQPREEKQVSFVERKATTAVRTKLSASLNVPRAYDLDRLDLTATASMDSEVQRAATKLLRSLKDPAGAKAAGLYGFRLLQEGDDPSRLTISFTLFERGNGMNLLRVQTDNVDQPFDLNEGARLDLGSTAKLRTLVTYLEIVADLHAKWHDMSRQELASQQLASNDHIGQWAREWLAQADDRDLTQMLEAAMDRKYSASPAEGFFTGGGLHHFENFEPEDNGRILTLREATRRSVNLVYIRVMRDIVYHVMAKRGGSATLLEDKDDPARQAYLEKFADREGKEYMSRFYRKYSGKSRQEAEDLLVQSMRPTPVRLASVFFGLEPAGDTVALASFLEDHLPATSLSDAPVQKLFDKYGPERWSLADRGYLAGVHPLEMWVVGYLRQHPGATLGDVFSASRNERQEVYGWLFKTRHKNAQDVRIKSLLELEAFLEIQKMWKRLGYPFESLTPSYATSIGASGDRPAALAELMGIIVNGGVRQPV
ncbi:MAG TPA: biosynthetic peptidoglycan transglycosylase, partial [Burkholderiaceae bacterium]|nr:biosynthetic peptidoglycan transglycosylase [Burkholderiaceae bacterium]